MTAPRTPREPKPQRPVDPAVLASVMALARDTLRDEAADGRIIQARTCRRCKGETRVAMRGPTSEQRLQAMLRGLPTPPPLPPQEQCPACYGLGSMDALREAEILRGRAARLEDAMGLLAEYCLRSVENRDSDARKCLTLTAHALQAHLGIDAESPELGRMIDLAKERH